MNWNHEITFNSSGELFVANRSANSVVVFSAAQAASGGNVTPIRIISGAATDLSQPHTVRFDFAANLIVTNTGNNSVQTYSPTATGNAVPLRTVTSSALNGPHGLAFDNQGFVYSANYSNSTLNMFDLPLELAFDNPSDSLHLLPPSGETVDRYVVHYNTQERIDNSDNWGIWAKMWPTGKTTLNLGTTKTAAGCQSLGSPNAICYRPPAIGEQGVGEAQSKVYRAYAHTTSGWDGPTTEFTVIRP